MQYNDDEMIESEGMSNSEKLNFKYILLSQIMAINKAKTLGELKSYISAVNTLEDNLYPYLNKEYIKKIDEEEKKRNSKISRVKPNERDRKNYEVDIMISRLKFRELMRVMVDKNILPKASIGFDE